MHGTDPRHRAQRTSDPREQSAWFQRLPWRRRIELAAEWEEERRRWVALGRQAWRQRLRTVLEGALLFGAADAVAYQLAPAHVALALAAGACVGLAWVLVRAEALFSGASGTAGYFLLQCSWIEQGECRTNALLWMSFVVGSASLWLGTRRGERAYE